MQREAISQNEVDGYKETEIGTIPAEWEVVELQDVTTITMGQSPPSSTYNTNGVGLPFLQGKAEFGEVYPNPIKFCSEPKKVAKPNSILISVRAPVGDVNLAPAECAIGRGLSAIDGAENTSNEFLFFYLIWAKKRLEERGTGSTFKSINKSVLQKFQIPLPPLDEQRRIAAVLSTIQKAIEKQERVIQAARELKRSLMHRLFTYGPYAEPAPTKETEIGDIPEHWKVTELCQLAVIEMGQSPPGSSYNNYGDGVPLINGPAEFTNKYPLAVKWTTKPTKVCNEGDILFCVRGNTTGRMNIADRKYCIGRGVAAISSRKKCSVTEYIRFLLELRASQILEYATAGGSTFPNITKGQLTSLLMPMPPYEEQKVIAYGLSVLDQKTETEQRKKNSLEALFKSMLHQLMTGQIRVLGLELSN